MPAAQKTKQKQKQKTNKKLKKNKNQKRAEIKSQTLNQLNHLGDPGCLILYLFVPKETVLSWLFLVDPKELFKRGL